MEKLKVLNVKTIEKYLPSLVTILIMLLPFCCEALKPDELQNVTDASSKYIMGNLSRIIMLAGGLTGIVVAFLKSSFVLLGIFLGIGVGGGLLLTFIDTTHTFIL